MSTETVFVAAYFFFIVSYYIFMIWVVRRHVQKKRVRAKLRRAVLSILDRHENPLEASEAIRVICSNLSKEHTPARANHKSAADMMEELYYVLETENRSPTIFSRFVSAKRPNKSEMQAIEKVMHLMRQEQPFPSLASPCGNLLATLKDWVDAQNSKELGAKLLKQLGDEIATLENSLRKQSRNNLIAIVVSVLGVVSTILFGILTTYQFFTSE